MRVPVASLAVERYVLSVTNHAPHTKYCRNIIAERRVRTSMGLAWGWSVFGGWPYDNAGGGEWEIGRGGEFLIGPSFATSSSPKLLAGLAMNVILREPWRPKDPVRRI